MWQRTIKIVKYSGFGRTKTNEQLAMERHRQLVNALTKTTLATISCSPQHEREWAIGYLYCTQGIKIHPESITVTGDTITWTGNEAITVAPIAPAEHSHLAVAALHQLTSQFQEAAILYKNTGTTQSAGIASTKALLHHAEDITDQGAFYKAVGKALSLSEPPQFDIGLMSGKVDDTTIKAWHHLGTTILISRGAPTDLAVDFATTHNMTLIGFARGTRFSIYTSPERIT